MHAELQAHSHLHSRATAPGCTEQDVATLFSAMMHTLCELGGSKLHACRTRETGYPVNPQHRMDIVLSAEPMPAKGQVGNDGMPRCQLRQQAGCRLQC